jgi:hypothetical protein
MKFIKYVCNLFQWRVASMDFQDPNMNNTNENIRNKSPLIPNLQEILNNAARKNVGNRKSSFAADSSPLKSLEDTDVHKIKSTDALQLGLLLSQQEKEYGVNMYESLQPDDEIEMERLMKDKGLNAKDAALEIFNRKLELPENPIAEVARLKVLAEESKSGGLIPKLASASFSFRDLKDAQENAPKTLKSRVSYFHALFRCQ